MTVFVGEIGGDLDMNDVERRFQKLIDEPGTVYCRLCKGAMGYASKGVYKCSACGWEYISNFGKVKRYIDEHGASTAGEIAEATGISTKIINQFVSEGRIEEVYHK